jgi:PAS domain S-box-containing protein
MIERRPDVQSADDAASLPDFLRGGGEMGRLIRAFDWSTTELGAPEAWPQALKTVIRVLLNSRHPMYIWWGPRLLCFYNDAYRRSIGPERHPGSLGQPGREVWAEIWTIIGPQIEQVMAGGPATWNENALVPITRNGKREDVYWTYGYGPIDDDAAPNRVGGVLVQCTETTQSVLREQERAEEIGRQRRLFQQAPGFIIIMRGPEHVVDFVNDAHRSVFGSEKWLGRPIREAFPSIAGQGYFEELDRVYLTGETFEAKGAPVRYERETGAAPELRYMNFIYAPTYDEQGIITGIFCDGYDVTDVVNATAALQQSEEQLRLATEAAEIGFWDVDLVNDALVWPERVKAMFGISAHVEVSMADFYAGLHPDDRPSTSNAFAAATDPARRAVYDVEYRTIGKEDGIVRWVAAKGKGVFEADQCVRVIGTAIDVTPRKLAEIRLRELRETLEQRVASAVAERAEAEAHLHQAQKLEAIGQLTGGVAHDFNNLLTVIRSSADLLRRHELSPEQRRRYVDAISDTADRAAKLTSQLLAFARRQALSPEVFDAAERVVAISDMLRTVVGSRVQLTIQREYDRSFVEADVTQFETALINMVVNARDAMDGEGRLTVAIREASFIPPIRGHAAVNGDFVTIEVTDTGAGLAQDQLSRIFEPFYTTKEVGKGTGLGLSQVYGFAKQSGGEVDVWSLPGEGATFRLYLPRADAPTQQHHAPTEMPFSASDAHVLVVEDNEQVGEFASQLLKDLGYGTTRAGNVREAMSLLESGCDKIDIVFSDVVMPGESGIDLARHIRSRWPNLAVVLTSGYSHVLAEDRRHGFFILHKPYSVEELSSALRRACAAAQRSTDSPAGPDPEPTESFGATLN